MLLKDMLGEGGEQQAASLIRTHMSRAYLRGSCCSRHDRNTCAPAMRRPGSRSGSYRLFCSQAVFFGSFQLLICFLQKMPGRNVKNLSCTFALWVQILSCLSPGAKCQVNWGVTSLPVQFKMFNSKCLKGHLMKERWSMSKNSPYVGEKWLL